MVERNPELSDRGKQLQSEAFEPYLSNKVDEGKNLIDTSLFQHSVSNSITWQCFYNGKVGKYKSIVHRQIYNGDLAGTWCTIARCLIWLHREHLNILYKQRPRFLSELHHCVIVYSASGRRSWPRQLRNHFTGSGKYLQMLWLPQQPMFFWQYCSPAALA